MGILESFLFRKFFVPFIHHSKEQVFVNSKTKLDLHKWIPLTVFCHRMHCGQLFSPMTLKRGYFGAHCFMGTNFAVFCFQIPNQKTSQFH